MAGTAATAQDLRQEERTMKRYEQRTENEMRREMRGMRVAERQADQEMRRAGRHMHPMKGPVHHAVKVVSYQSALVGQTVDMDMMINYDGILLEPNEEFVITP